MSEPLLFELSNLIAQETGLRFTDERKSDLEHGLRAVARELGFGDVSACAHWLLSSPLSERHISILASHLTVGETYFFRDRPSFQALRAEILPALIQRKRDEGRTLRIWSAGCSTGEEIYSIAITLRELIPDLDDWRLTLLATDINTSALQKATAAQYGNWSFRDHASPPMRYFTRTPAGRYRMDESIRRLAKFGWLNLAENSYPSNANDTHSMDLILCRNVLMYLTPTATAGVLQRLQASLVNDGWLLVGPGEAPDGTLPGFDTVSVHDCVMFRKRAGHTVVSSPSGGLLFDTRAIESLQESPFDPVASHPVFPPAPTVTISAMTAGATDSDSATPTAVTQHPTSPPENTLAPSSAEPGRPSENRDDVKAISEMARSCANEGRLDEASAWCRQAIRMDKLNPAHSFLFASVREEQGRFGEAEQLLRQTLYLDPEFVLAHVALGHLALRRGAAADSRRHFGNALALLSRYRPEDTVPLSDGITAGRLAEIVNHLSAA